MVYLKESYEFSRFQGGSTFFQGDGGSIANSYGNL